MKTEMDFDRILKLWDRFEASSAVRFELEFQGTRLSFEKAAEAGSGAAARPAEVSADQAACTAAGSADQAAGMAKASGSRGADADLEILAPLVGTFYRAASPEKEPFVKVGQRVRKGDVVGIIEAMKLMNEVTADHDGIVKEIPAENGALVSFHQTLVRLRPDQEKDS